MISAHSIRWLLLSCALLLALGPLAVETSAQSRSTPKRPLSDAVAEVLRSPFHGDRASLGQPGQGFLLSAAGYPSATQGPTAGLSMGLPNTGAQEAGTSTDRLVGMTAFGAVASHVAAAFFLRCQAGRLGDPGRFTGPGWPGVVGVPPGPRGSRCPFLDDHSDLVGSVFLLVVPTLTTAGAATLGGSGFLRAVGGSALGLAGSLLFYRGMTGLTTGSLESLSIPFWLMGGFMHGVTTAYFSNRGQRKGGQTQ